MNINESRALTGLVCALVMTLSVMAGADASTSLFAAVHVVFQAANMWDVMTWSRQHNETTLHEYLACWAGMYCAFGILTENCICYFPLSVVYFITAYILALPVPKPHPLWIDGMEYSTHSVRVVGGGAAKYLTPYEVNRLPLHTATVGNVPPPFPGFSFNYKTLHFEPTYLSWRLPRVTVVEVMSCLPSYVAAKNTAMQYVNRGLPVPAAGARWMTLPLNKRKPHLRGSLSSPLSM